MISSYTPYHVRQNRWSGHWWSGHLWEQSRELRCNYWIHKTDDTLYTIYYLINWHSTQDSNEMTMIKKDNFITSAVSHIWHYLVSLRDSLARLPFWTLHSFTLLVLDKVFFKLNSDWRMHQIKFSSDYGLNQI